MTQNQRYHSLYSKRSSSFFLFVRLLNSSEDSTWRSVAKAHRHHAVNVADVRIFILNRSRLWTPRAARQHVHSYRERTEKGADVEGSRRGSRTTCRGDMPQHRSIQAPFREQAFWKLSACRLADRPDESRVQALFTASVTHGDGWTGAGRPQVALEAAARSQLQNVLGSIKYVTDVWDITTCCLASVWSYIRTYRPEVSGNASEITLIISLRGVFFFWKGRQRCFYKSTSIRVSVTHI